MHLILEFVGGPRDGEVFAGGYRLCTAFFIAGHLLILAAGCSSSPGPLTDEGAKALEIAKTAISEHPELHDYVEFDPPQHDSETDHWSVTVWRNKRSKAGCVVVEIDGDGKVTEVAPQM
jgi:hypothetical protein